jgi:acetyl esterase/lipase
LCTIISNTRYILGRRKLARSNSVYYDNDPASDKMDSTNKINGDGNSNSSIKITHRNDLSLLYRIMRVLIRPLRPKLAGMPKKPWPSGSPKLSPPSLKNVTIKDRSVENIFLYTLVPTSSRKHAPTHSVYYFAGGGFQSPPSKDHWKLCASLAEDLCATHEFTVVSYPLAPENTAAVTLPILQSLLRVLMREASEAGKSVVLAGDSSGGNLAVCLGFWWAKELQQPLAHMNIKDVEGAAERPKDAPPPSTPLSVFAMAPAVDLTNQNPQINEIDKFEPLLTIATTTDVAKKYTGSTTKRDDPSVSPLFDDFEPVRRADIRVNGLVGTYDLLAPDDQLFIEKLKEHQVEGEWMVWEGQMHCFPLAFAYGIRESKEGKEWIVGVLRRDAERTDKSKVDGKGVE